MSKRFVFLSLHRSSLKIDFLCLKHLIEQYNSEYEIDIFWNNVDVQEKNKVLSIRQEISVLELIESDWIGIEGFLAGILNNKTVNNRYLFLEPFDYLFGINWNKNSCRKLLLGYTHVVTFSEFWAEQILRYKKGQDIQLMRNVELPFLSSMHDKSFVEKCRVKLIRDFSVLIDKKIIYVYLTGQCVNVDAFDAMNLRQVLENLPEKCIIITNSIYLRRACRVLKSGYKDKFIYVKENDCIMEILMMADYLLSNDSYCCSLFASMNKPYAILQYSNNYFERYIEKKHPFCIVKHSDFPDLLQEIVTDSYRSPMIEEIMMRGRDSVIKKIW